MKKDAQHTTALREMIREQGIPAFLLTLARAFLAEFTAYAESKSKGASVWVVGYIIVCMAVGMPALLITGLQQLAPAEWIIGIFYPGDEGIASFMMTVSQFATGVALGLYAITSWMNRGIGGDIFMNDGEKMFLAYGKITLKYLAVCFIVAAVWFSLDLGAALYVYFPVYLLLYTFNRFFIKGWLKGKLQTVD